MDTVLNTESGNTEKINISGGEETMGGDWVG